MICSCSIPNPLVRDGLSQDERPLPALDPARAPLDGRSEAELWAHLSRFAKTIHFTEGFDENGEPIDAGDWTSFFPSSLQPGVHPPPAALLKTFLALYRRAQADVDGVMGRQLDWWLQEVLRLQPLPPRPDRAFVAFEFAKQAQPSSLPEGTLLLGGKDEAGFRRYALEQEVRVEGARIAGLHAVRRDARGRLRAATLEASAPDVEGFSAFGDERAPLSRVGFSLASRILACGKGATRIFKATLQASGLSELLGDGSMEAAFDVELYGADGWFRADSVVVSVGTSLQLTFTLGPKAPEVVAPPGKEAPSCRVTLRQDVLPYTACERVRVEGGALSVEVRGATGVKLVTADGPADPSRPFAPFGAQPMPGSSFTVELPELEGIGLTSVSLALEWLQPTGKSHLDGVYAAYPIEEQYEQLAERWISRQKKSESRKAVAKSASSLFKLHLETLGGGRAKSEQPKPFFADSLGLELVEPTPIDGVRVKLDSPLHGFGHRLYPTLHAQAVLAAAQNSSASAELPQPPITPRAGKVDVTYAAVDESPAYSHLHPFGESEANWGTSLLPAYPNEGELYIGLLGARPQSKVSLLFHCDDGTADPLLRPAALQWSVLQRGGGFAAVDPIDGTLSLTRSGVSSVVLPAVATDEGGQLPAGPLWLRVCAPARTAATCTLREILPNAGIVALQDAASHPAHLEQGLSPSTITKLQTPRAEVKKVLQPLPSFGGRPLEPAMAMRRRMAERMRHKDRAVTLRDYETLVLEAFPDLYKARCLNHTRVTAEADHEIAPGHVTMVLVARPTGRVGRRRFTPLVSLDRLAEVERFLAARIGPSLRLQAANPTYQPIRAAFSVKLKSGVDPAGAIERCARAIDGLLSPWAFDERAEVPFGGQLHRSTVLGVVEHVSGVDFVADFRIERADGAPGADVESIAADTARSVLVSAGDHRISVIEEAGT